ncbi:hypothetical protein Q9L42_020990 (plasmid) [Methylomarinum sp. Ch1-1]|uniref:Uncharacterized protein n=1 Tax=Methylomarinum roseum TaxID=3067653 RepID=A0AAU7P0S4_9GAMM|nr:hypothetical protein [Methylomarinum sp. Ch1-1]MDP4519001.1 hypothetical protein [Methylomarinum sp. Ch1-1]MDP4523399.1 hypothetical protein [Methylomarinum sp. Ch1-1]
MTNYDEAYANASLMQASQNIADASAAIANRHRAKAQARKVNNALQAKDEYIAELIRRGDIWEDRAVSEEAAKDAWIQVMRSLVAENRIVGLNKDQLNARFHKIYDSDVEKRKQAVLAKRRNR